MKNVPNTTRFPKSKLSSCMLSISICNLYHIILHLGNGGGQRHRQQQWINSLYDMANVAKQWSERGGGFASATACACAIAKMYYMEC